MVSGILERLGIEALNLAENHGSDITVGATAVSMRSPSVLFCCAKQNVLFIMHPSWPCPSYSIPPPAAHARAP